MKRQSNVRSRPRLPEGSIREHSDDLTPRDCLTLAIGSAFPLPRTGAFTDLLKAIDGYSL